MDSKREMILAAECEDCESLYDFTYDIDLEDEPLEEAIMEKYRKLVLFCPLCKDPLVH